jgi:hypothetical protein
VLRASVTGAVSDSGAHSDRAPRTVRPQQIGLEHYRPACLFGDVPRSLLEGYEWKFASHHRTEKSDGLASMRDSMRGWLDLDRVGRGDLDRRPAGEPPSARRGSAGSGSRRGVLTPRCERAPGPRGMPGALPLSARSPVRAAFSAPTGLRGGAARGGEGAPLRGHQQALVTPVPAQIVWSGRA